jgi:hypothetical protein
VTNVRDMREMIRRYPVTIGYVVLVVTLNLILNILNLVKR